MNRKPGWLFLLIFSFISSFATGQTYKFHNEWIDYGKTYYKFKVMGFGNDNVGAPIRNGIVRIPFSTLASAGLSGTSAENFQLWRDGEEVAIYVSKPSGSLSTNDYIEFFGEINNGNLDKELYRNPDYQLNDKWSLQTDTAAYFLTANPASANKRIVAAANNTSQNTLSPDSYFMYTVGRYFRNNISNGFAATLGKSLYSSSYDKGEGWVSRAVRPVAGCGSATLPQSFTNLYPYAQGPLMTFRINAIGDAQNSRSVRINLNTDSINTFQMDYINYVKDQELIDVNKISSGAGTFYVINNSPNGCDEMRIGMIELTYPRVFNMGGASVFKFSVDSSSKGRYLAITNFKHSGVAPVLYDLANNKRYAGDISNVDTVKVVLEPSSVPYDLVLTTQYGTYYKQIANLQTRNFVNFKDAANQGNYLIISNPLIYGNGSSNYVEQYRQYRSSLAGGSFNAKVVDINELVDQFAWGVKKHPLSVKNFLRYAASAFTDSPKYVFLIGKGVMYSDYRLNESNALADQLNLVPTFGNPASDNLLASRDFTAVPAIPIGRLSVVTPQEVGDYLAKVKQYDSVQRSPVQTIEAKGWMKNVIQIAGANDDGTGALIDGYLANYKKVISDTSFGANVIGFSKFANPTGYPEAINSFKQVYEQGASLITYFGHSSSTSLDFNLDNPATYNNQYKYPIFIANGCTAGDHFLFEPDRFNTKSTVSEKFVLSPQRGAVGYLASTGFGIVNYLDSYTQNFYKALGKTKYNQSIGAAIKEGIATALASKSPNDYYNRVHSEQYAYHGDPAIVMNASVLPDYVIEKPQMQVSPSFVSVADTGFTVKIKVNNIGRATKAPVTLKIIRQFPSGDSTTILTKTFTTVYLVDSVTVNVPVIANRDKGLNKITAIADFNNNVEELSEDNNAATIDVLISEDEIRPAYPFNYAVITDPNLKLSASTVNPLNISREYIMELDTTALFNSQVKITKSKTCPGGVIEFDPGISYQDSVTYYWRVAPASLTQPHWVSSSFMYKSNTISGFEQGHLYQNLQSQFTRLTADSTTGKYSYQNKLHNLFITNSVYPTSGTEDEHFSISVDGSAYIKSACVGYSIIFNVFDSLTFQPVKNLTNPFNAAAVCDVGREYNFEYQYLTAQSRKNAMDFLDAVPKGSYVTARLILADPYNSFASNWAADTILYGKKNSLYHRLKQAGFAAIDSFSYPRTWAFVYRKGDTTFTPSYALSRGLFDRITLSVNCTTLNQAGDITSPVFGPSKQWKDVYWNGYSEENGNDVAVVNVYGIKRDNSDTLLYKLNSSTHNFDISSVNAVEYPFVCLKMNNADSVTATPYQLKRWGLGYVPVAEGAIAPNLYYNIPDTTGASNEAPGKASLNVGFAFKNVSNSDFDSLSLKVVLYDTVGRSFVYHVPKLRAVPAGDTVHVDLSLDVSSFKGWYNLYAVVNPDNDQPEQFSFNNFLYKQVYINSEIILPLTLLDFNATLQSGDVKTVWSVSSEVSTSQYEIQHSANGTSFSKIGTVTPTKSSAANKSYSFVHLNPSIGNNYYRLKIIETDGTFKYSPVRLLTINNSIAVNMFPNPVKDILNISVNRRDGKSADVRVVNAFGQQLWQRKINGTVQVDMKKWASGTYVVQVDETSKMTVYKVQKQ